MRDAYTARGEKMIKIDYDDRHLSISGHANYDEYGKDIVCAAVSALYCTLVAKVRQDEARGLLNADIDMESEVKTINIKYIDPSHKDLFREYWHCITNGLMLMSLEYSDYIVVG